MAAAREIDAVRIDGGDDIRTAIRKLTVCGKHVLFVTEKSILKWALTDGDISKFLLRDDKLDSPVREAANIQTRNLFAGNITKHPCFEMLKEGSDYRIVGQLANTDTIMNFSLWIGLYPGMGEAKLDYMIKTIREFCGK